MKCKKALVVVSLMMLVISCGGDSKKNKASSSGLFDSKPYSSNSHPNLFCALAVYDTVNDCNLATLPLIGMQTANPSTADIASRVLVSHDWMGERFITLLDTLPADIKLMLRSVTAVVIDSNIRPSFYTTQTGAIYIDPYSLWLVQSEKNTISDEADFRSEFSNELAFSSLWRYLNNDGTWAYLPSAGRTMDDLRIALAQVLYHELAHANTFLPPNIHNQINPAQTVWQAADSFIASNSSASLNSTYPLQSEEMKGLAKVMFTGEAASSEQKAYTPAEVGAFLDADRANDDYAYVEYNDGLFHEDAAMLFEELMMKYHYNLDREIAYTDAASSPYCNDYIIKWGQTGRIGKADVKQAALHVTQLLVPESNLNDFVANLELPTDTDPNQDWCGPFELEEKQLGKGLSAKGVSSDLMKTDISENLRSPHNR